MVKYTGDKQALVLKVTDDKVVRARPAWRVHLGPVRAYLTTAAGQCLKYKAEFDSEVKKVTSLLQWFALQFTQADGSVAEPEAKATEPSSPSRKHRGGR